MSATPAPETSSSAPRIAARLTALRAFGGLGTSRVLMFVLTVLTLAASFYLWMLHTRSADLIRGSAEREIRALLSGIDFSTWPETGERIVGSVTIRTFPADSAALQPPERGIVERLRAAGGKLSELRPEHEPTHLHFAERRNGRVVAVEWPVAEIAAPIYSHLARSYISVGILSFIFIGGLVWLYWGTRRDLAVLYAADSGVRTGAIEALVPTPDGSESRNLLPWIMSGALVVFLLDWSFGLMPLSGGLYVLAVMLSVNSTRAWHTVVVAAWTLALSFLAILLSPPPGPLWPALSSHALIAYFIVGMAAFGLALMRRIRTEAQALASATQAHEESEQLRVALTRAEAADARVTAALERLTLATQYAGISVWEWDLVADIVYPTEGSEFRARLGTTTHLRGGEFLRDFVHPDDRDEFAEAFRVAITDTTGNGQISHRYRSYTIEGALQYIQLHARVYRDNHGRALRIVGVDWNATAEVEATMELHRQAEQLRDAERRLARASLSSLEGHWETDLLSGQSWISTSFQELMGFAPGEFEAMQISASELAHPDDKARVEASYLAHLQEGKPFDLQLRLCNARGEYHWFRMQGAAERDSDGRPIRVSGSVQNIQQQRAAEDALREAQARFQRAVNGAQDGLFDYDLVTDEAWFSPRCKQILGYEEHEFDIKVSELPEHVHPEDVPRLRDAFIEHAQRRSSYDIEYRLRRKNGEWFWARSRAVAEYGRNGRAVRVSGSVQDITDERAARELLLAATKAAESANDAKSAFLATMSHEIRTPMNGVIGMTGLLLDTDLDRLQREYANTIRSSADSLLHVINDILDFSKIEAGKLEIDVTDMDLRANVEDVCSMMALQAAANKVELVVDMRPETPELVRGDAQRIRQCLLNLLSNAVKFTPSGEIVVEVCVLAQQPHRTLVQFSVRDTGIGLSAEQMANLFQPFVQADASTTRRFGGTGLGLSIVKSLVEMMGGRVGVESEPEKGATFWFTLPLQPLDPTGRFTRVSPATVGKSILVVDDNEANRKVLGGQLARSGFNVALAAEGAEALRLLKQAAAEQRPFDVALLDFHMPGMDGAALGEIINADQALSTTRLILLTSLDRAGDQQRFAAIGFAAYLTKPIRARELKECLDRALASEAKEWHLQSQPMLTRNVLTDVIGEPQYSGNVLLVEDNAVNRQVAQKYLERLGCHVRIAVDGQAAVDAFKEEKFHLILMDMQMPVMDGIAATRAIRALERGGRHTPIVALTANVLAGQLERCLEAGMEDFLTKPLDVNRLRDVLDRFGLAATESVPSSASAPMREAPARKPSDVADEPALDFARVDGIADGDAPFARELLTTYVQSMQEMLAELRQAIEEDDRERVGKVAHKIKGASGNVGAPRAQRLAKELEQSAKNLGARALVAAVKGLEKETERVRREAERRYPAASH